MSQYILVNRIKVQNANAIAGFTWGFPGITNFLGYVQNLARTLAQNDIYQDISLSGCSVVAHEHNIHNFRPSYDYQFIQSRNPAYIKKDAQNLDNQGKTPPIIEEGKMNMTVSLLISYDGNIGNREEAFKIWFKNNCQLQRLAGGTILDISNVEIFSPENDVEVRSITYQLLPGFLLMDRSDYLEQHFQELKSENENVELLDAWLDFSSIKQKARPKSDLISKYLQKLIKKETDNQDIFDLVGVWQQHLNSPYNEGDIPNDLIQHFDQLTENKTNRKLKEQWKKYCNPDEKTDADWEYLPKPQKGYLIPIMIGYKGISEVFKNVEVENTRDSETDVCFVESVHSIGEWLSVHRVKTSEQLQNSLWHYHYEENWYLCKQNKKREENLTEEYIELNYENPEDEF